MTPTDHQRAGDIFIEVIEHDTADQDEVLRNLCGDESGLEREVRSLLQARRAMGTFLESSALERSQPLGPGDVLAGFEIVSRLESGGAGDVYEARQHRPDRRVALKVMRSGLHEPHARNRFFEEAQTLADLSHPGISHVYDVGVADHRPYLVIEYVEGARNLRTYCDENNLTREERLGLLSLVCDATHYAHQKRVIHRDLKPENILVDAGGHPKIIDFGISSVAGTKVDRTGTLHYMSPQQRTGNTPADVRDDVFALGVLVQDLMQFHFSKDVDAIVRRATAEAPAARYDSAAALRSDLRRVLDHYPVEALQGGWRDSIAKFATRHKLGCAALTLSALLLIGGAIGGALLAVEKDRQRRTAVFEAYRGNIAAASAASAALRIEDVAEVARNLEEAPLEHRGWEWFHLAERVDESEQQFNLEGMRLWCGAASADGTVVAAAFQSLGSVRWHIRVWRADDKRVLWDHELDTRRRVDAVAIQSTPPHIVIGRRDGDIEVYDYEVGYAVGVLRGHRETINALVLTADGHLFSGSRDRTIAEWDMNTMSRVREYCGHSDRVICLAVDRKHQIMASGGREGAVLTWNLDTGHKARTLLGHDSSVEGVAIHPEGQRLVSVSRDRSVRQWDLASGKPLRVRQDHTSNVHGVAYSPDGDVFATASWDRSIRLWRDADASPLRTMRGHQGMVTAVAFLNNRKLVSLARDDSIRLWDTRSIPALASLVGHRDIVRDCTFPDHAHVISVSVEGVVKTWELRNLTCLDTWDTNLAPLILCAASRNWIVVSNGTRHVGRRRGPRTEAQGHDVRFSETAKDLECRGDTVHVIGSALSYASWHLPTQKPHRVSLPHIERIALAVSADEKQAWAGTVSGAIERVAGTPTGPRMTEVHSGRVLGLDYCDGRGLLASCSTDGTAALVRDDSLDVVHRLTGHRGLVFAVVFSPDGTRVATGGQDGTIRLWDVNSGKQMAVLHGHKFFVRTLAFSPDGQYLVSGGGTDEVPGNVRVWRAPQSHAK